MDIVMLKSKIHRATVTEANIDYVGSITIDEKLLEESGIHEYEKVQVVDINNGSRFEGKWYDGHKTGNGKLFFNNGSRYEGSFKNDNIDGKGILYYNNNEKYDGNFSNNECNGQGIFYFNNGDKTEGKFTKHKATGVHTRNLANGQVQKITY